MKEEKYAGYCSANERLIVIADFDDKDNFHFLSESEKDTYAKRTLRHEIIHAFLNESGLSDSASVPVCSWAKHEEMVDWIAIQSPKIFEIFQKLCIL